MIVQHIQSDHLSLRVESTFGLKQQGLRSIGAIRLADVVSLARGDESSMQ